MSKVRFPFRLKVYDQNLMPIVTPPVWLEFDEPKNEGGWDWLLQVENEAKAILLADMECSVDWDTSISEGAENRDKDVPNSISNTGGDDAG